MNGIVIHAGGDPLAGQHAAHDGRDHQGNDDKDAPAGCVYGNSAAARTIAVSAGRQRTGESAESRRSAAGGLAPDTWRQGTPIRLPPR